MPLNDNAVITAAVGHVFHAEPGTPPPTAAALKTINLTNPGSWAGSAGWASTGHTSEGDLPEWGFEGGDTEVRGTWQKKKLREITTEDLVDYLTMVLQQFDEETLSLYYGENASNTPGEFGVGVGTPTPRERAVLVVIVDRDVRIGFYVYKASARRDDSIQLPDDDFVGFPIRFTFLEHEEEPLLFKWINEDLFNTDEEPVVYTLSLGGATSGNYVLNVGPNPTSSIAYNANAAAIKSAIAAVDDGIPATAFEVTPAGGGFEITGPRGITVESDSTAGGTGVTVS